MGFVGKKAKKNCGRRSHYGNPAAVLFNLLHKTNYIPAVFPKNGMHFSAFQSCSSRKGRNNMVWIGFCVDCFQIIVCQHNVLRQMISFELTQIAGDFHIFIQTLIIITNEEGVTTSILGVSIGGGNVKLKQINGADISLSGNLTTLFVQQYDRPGVVAHISKCLNDHNVNIAFMKLYRDNKGENAYTIIETDEKLDERLVDEIQANPNIKSAIVIEL